MTSFTGMIAGILVSAIGVIGLTYARLLIVVVGDFLVNNFPVTAPAGEPAFTTVAANVGFAVDAAMVLLILSGLILAAMSAYKREPNDLGY